MDALITISKVLLGFLAVVLIISAPFAILNRVMDRRNVRLIRERLTGFDLHVVKIRANRSSYGVWFRHGVTVHHAGCQVRNGHLRWVGQIKPEVKALLAPASAPIGHNQDEILRHE